MRFAVERLHALRVTAVRITVTTTARASAVVRILIHQLVAIIAIRSTDRIHLLPATTQVRWAKFRGLDLLPRFTAAPDSMPHEDCIDLAWERVRFPQVAL
jgi:hypothetical protein